MADDKKNELDIIQEAEAESVEVYDAEPVDEANVIHLKKPMRSGAAEIHLDFDRVTGYILLKCEKEAKKDDPLISVMALSQSYQARVAAAAAKVKYDEILELSGADFTAVCLKVQNFLMGSR
ncbi:hypothetical protein [uncultured Selenomonas sp.]|uniref:hypothetical protein n=1 Tax=uncultured Selenomonas sp. TaxID=159275 RepID=UPI0028E498E9|nr:hypothetical protein [uncultured Selenomonas sp.]